MSTHNSIVLRTGCNFSFGFVSVCTYTLVVCCLVLVPQAILGQHVSTNQLFELECKGAIPSEFTMALQQRVKVLHDAFDWENSDPLQAQATEKFLEQAAISSHSLLHSGEVLYGDAISLYVQKVGQELLSHHPEIEGEVKFYVLDNESVNALSTYDGFIFINIGLIAHLTTEAELAFVLAHEICHYREKHTLTAFYEHQKLSDLAQEPSSNVGARQQSAFSRVHELQADSIGLELLSGTKYDVAAAANGALTALYNSDMSFIQKAVDFSYLNQGQLHIPQSYLQGEIVDVERTDNYYDQQHTHPNIRRRREQVKGLLDSVIDVQLGKDFCVSRDEFFEAQNIARLEYAKLQTVHANYGEALYTILHLKERFPSHLKYLECLEAKVWYKLAKYKNKEKLGDALRAVNQTPGFSQNVHYFFRYLRQEQLNTIAFRRILDLQKKHPQHSAISHYRNELLKDKMLPAIFKQQATELGFFRRTPLSLAQLEAYDKKQDWSKGEQVVLRKQHKEFHFYAFVDDLKDASFVESFERNAAEVSKQGQHQKTTILLGFPRCDVEDEFTAALTTTREIAQLVMELQDDTSKTYGLMGFVDFSTLTTEQLNDQRKLYRWFDEMIANEGVVLPFREELFRLTGLDHVDYFFTFRYVDALKPKYDYYFPILYDLNQGAKVKLKYFKLSKISVRKLLKLVKKTIANATVD
jgi:predicted Zn-dependent protease